MGRTPSPRYRKERDLWYVTLGARRHTLAHGKENKPAAMEAFGRLLAEHRKPVVVAPDSPMVGELIARFIAHCKRQVERQELTPDTLLHYQKYLQHFHDSVGMVEAVALKPIRIIEWLDGKTTWNATTRAGAITAIKRVFRWSTRLGLIPVNPIAELPKPTPVRRENIPDEAGVSKILEGCICPHFRLLLEVIHRTGCRPGEARKLTAADLNAERGIWVKAGKSTHRTKRLRVVHVPADLMARLIELASIHPVGPILRNKRGKPWRADSVGQNLRRIRNLIGGGSEMVAYGLRHLFATDGLERGVPIATMAELLGHSSTKMISERYSHLADRHEHLKSALEVVRGPKANGKGEAG